MSAVPNDPFFEKQWGERNTAQPIPEQEAEEVLGKPVAGTAGADDRVYEAWGVTTGSRSIVIGETDTGVDYAHPDLAANIWTNPGGVGGCEKGTHGFNVLEPLHACEPMDEEPPGQDSYGGHGTHVAGIIGAVGNNATGVTGLNWQTSILPVKWLSSAGGTNSTEDLIKALEALVAAKQAGVNVRVVNDSPTFPRTPYSQALSDEIDVLGENNILFVTAAGNTGDNNDEESVRRYPCGYDRPNEICVTATDNKDQLPSWANYGKTTVDLAAPGVSIYSTLREDKYNYLSGGSMAAAQVSGAAALILSAKPALSATELKADILNNVDPLPSLASKVRTGGRLDVAGAMLGTVTDITPNSGPAAGGTAVTVTGANLSRVTAVKFGSSNATGFTVNSPTTITATSPAGTGIVDVTVTTPGGTSAIGDGDRFSYVAELPVGPPVQTQPPGTTEAPGTAAPGTPPGQSFVLGTTTSSSAIVLATATLTVRGGRAAIRLRCVGSKICASKLSITVRTAIHHQGRPTTTRLQAIGRAGFSVRAGQTASVTVNLNATGRALLSAGRGKLKALLTILRSTTGPSSALTKTIHLLATTSNANKSSGWSGENAR